MRIKSLSDLSGLGENAKSQLAKQFNCKPEDLSKTMLKVQSQFKRRADSISEYRSINPVISESSKISKPPPDIKTKNRTKPSRIKADEFTGLKYCPYPSSDPAVWLHKAIEKEFGSYWSGGCMASEVILPGHEVKFRYDFALINYRVFIEFDGYAFHSKLGAFKKDRRKGRFALTQGWVVYSVTNSMVREELDVIISELKLIVSNRQVFNEGRVEMVGNTQSKYNSG